MPDICYGQYQVCHFCGSPKCVRPCSCRLQSSTLARLIWSKLGKAGTQDEGAFLDGSVIWWAMIATRSQTLISPLRSPTAWHSNWSSTPRCTTHSCSDMALPCLLVRESESLVSLKKAHRVQLLLTFSSHLSSYSRICVYVLAAWLTEVNAGLQKQINVSAHFGRGLEWPWTGEHPSEWENFPH